MKIREVMTAEPTCCAKEDTAQQAAIVMQKLDVGVVPIVKSEEDKTLVGVVTDRDLCMAVVASGKDPASITVGECMSDDVISCKANDDAQTVLDLMFEHQIRRIPVVDQESHVAGIVSTADVALNMSPPKVGETLNGISEPDAA